MFEALTERLTGVFNRLSGRGRITEADVEEALREVRRALLEADVNLRVVRELQQSIRDRAVGEEVLQSVTPVQQIIKIVQEELTDVLGKENRSLDAGGNRPATVLLVGLQGSGKTTTAAKLASNLVQQGQAVSMGAGDVRRPAAIEQLTALGNQINVPVHAEPGNGNAVAVAKSSLAAARDANAHWHIFDTGGRLQVDDELMKELADVRKALNPAEVLLVVDAMTGQDAVNAAEEFHRQVPLTGLVLTKMDGDARGGAALSITSVTGLPVMFIGVGERMDALEPFYPDRLAGRILGMGDVVTLVEKAQQTIDEEKAQEMERKLRTASFDLNDFLEQMDQLRNMGGMANLVDMIPGFSQMKGKLPTDAFDEKQIKRVEAIVLSMTPEERQRPDIIGGSRRKRIARGSGTQPADVNRLLNQFGEMRKMMRQLSSGKKIRGLPFKLG
ncbi:MAG: signal recognition particle protein [Dehalococcoidia bacterium]|nr:signal recognition particle protein [Dehalococcoidia bacterium]